ncbi:MAG: hypothetical protein IPJ03_16230 [Ignavibacteriales bacterium]|nr:hypothetical protein [Ignavibacteriales bacterium]
MKIEMDKKEVDLLMDLILAELETARRFRIKFTDQQLRESESLIEQRLKELYTKLNSFNFEDVK